MAKKQMATDAGVVPANTAEWSETYWAMLRGGTADRLRVVAQQADGLAGDPVINTLTAAELAHLDGLISAVLLAVERAGTGRVPTPSVS